jgi:hypothetical protein
MNATILYIFMFISQTAASVSWHAYDKDMTESLSSRGDCRVFNTKPQEYNETRLNHIGLWPGLSMKKEIAKGEVLFGFKEAAEAIWKHQNPVDCSSAKYMIIGCYPSGFGSMIHVEAALMSLAMKMGRIYLRYPTICDYHHWAVDNDHCRNQGKMSFDCYYKPLSRCMIQV